VPRTDSEGRTLETVLDAVLGRRVERAELFGALGISSSTYFRRRDEDDFPNAEELRMIAMHFELNAAVMMVSFGLLEENDVTATAEQIAQIRAAEQLMGRVEGTADFVPLAKTIRKEGTTRIRPKLKYSVRGDLPGFDRP
jgi:hypothetical protein